MISGAAGLVLPTLLVVPIAAQVATGDSMLSKCKLLSTTANISRTIDELESDSCIATLLRVRRAVGVPLRGQTTVGLRGLGSRDQEQRTWRAPLREYVLVHYTAAT